MIKILTILLFFIYLYSIHLAFLPYSLSFILGGAMLVYLFAKRCLRTVNRDVFSLFLVGLLVVTMSILTSLVNDHYDSTFVKEYIIYIIMIGAFSMIYSLLKEKKHLVNFERIAHLFIISAAIQAILSLVFLLSKGIMRFALSFLQYSELASMKVAELSEFRLIGFGVQFFDAGVIYGFVLMIITTLLANNNYSVKRIFVYTTAYAFVFIVGMMTARTTIIGAGLSLLIFLPKIGFSKMQKIAKAVLLFSVFCVIIIANLPSAIYGKITSQIPWAFEMFINYFNEGSFSTNSTESMKEMYIFPETIKTWIIGDAHWSEENGLSYYMKTDIGYIRLIYYFGIIGTVLFLLFQGKLLALARKQCDKKYSFFFLVVMLYLCVILLKGYYSLFILVLPFCFIREELEE